MAERDAGRTGYGFPPALAINVVAKRLREQLPRFDQRMHLLRVLLERLEAHALRIGNPTVVVHQDVLHDIAYDEWAEGRSRERGGQHDAPVQADIHRLLQYWKRTLRDLGATASFQIEKEEDGFAIIHELSDPDHTIRSIRFVLRAQPQFLSLTAVSDDTAQSALSDPRVQLHETSVYRALHEASESLLTAFQRTTKDVFTYSGRTSEITVKRSASFLRKPLAWISLAVVLLLLIGGVQVKNLYAKSVATVRKQMFNVSYGMALGDSCDRGVPRVRISWQRRAPTTWATSVWLFRNGEPLAKVDDKNEYTDLDVRPGQTYVYSLAIRDLLGGIVVEDPVVVSTTIQCGDEDIPPRVSVSPASGTWATTFVFIATPPKQDGIPATYSWNRRGSVWDARRGELFQEWSPPTTDPTLKITFNACDHCPQNAFLRDGTSIKHCSVAVNVTMTDGRRIQYQSPYVTISDYDQWECRAGVPTRSQHRYIPHP